MSRAVKYLRTFGATVSTSRFVSAIKSSGGTVALTLSATVATASSTVRRVGKTLRTSVTVTPALRRARNFIYGLMVGIPGWFTRADQGGANTGHTLTDGTEGMSGPPQDFQG